MKTLRRLLTIFVLPALVLAGFAVSTVAANGDDDQETICHFASNQVVRISVSKNAESAHLRQGDVLPDEYGDCDGEHENGDDNGDNNDNEQGEHDGDHSNGPHDNGDHEGNSDD
ncbi:MAG: hypothetical protein M3R05_05835 [Chloroflexota bacterium]|nr:hypothetical protein [Chloroflexota bacterium]